MTAETKIDVSAWFRKQLEAAPDGMRDALAQMLMTLMDAEVDGICGAGYGERSEDRQNSRNGYRPRTLDTRVGTMELDIPKLRKGSYFPTWLMEPRRRAERALTQVIAEAYLLGVSTRRVEELVQSLGIERISKSQVSELAKSLDVTVKSFRERRLEGQFKYIWLDALVFKSREAGRIVNVAGLIAVGVNDDGHREVLGFDVITVEDGAGWLAFLRSLKARGLSGVELVISDAHQGVSSHAVSRSTGGGFPD